MKGRACLNKTDHAHNFFKTSFQVDAPGANSDLRQPELVDGLETIDCHALEALRSLYEQDYENAASECSTPAAPPVPAAPIQHLQSTPPAHTTPTQSSIQEIPEVAVGEEVIRSCVTPRKVSAIQAILQKETQRHKCALKLLPFFFSKEELSSSNTEGTHQKLPLDTTRLNSLKVLVFN